MRAFVGERHVLDSTRGMLLHESNIKPVYYAPIEDFAADVLVDSATPRTARSRATRPTGR